MRALRTMIVPGMPVLLLLTGCYVSTTQTLSSGGPFPVDVQYDAPPLVQLDQGSAVQFAAIRVVGDTLYAWVPSMGHVRPDSQAIPVRRIVSLQQRHIDVHATLINVGFTASLLIAAWFVAMVKFND